MQPLKSCHLHKAELTLTVINSTLTIRMMIFTSQELNLLDEHWAEPIDINRDEICMQPQNRFTALA